MSDPSVFSPDEYPLEHVQALVDEVFALQESRRSFQRWRSRVLVDLRHAHERIRQDLAWDAEVAIRRIPEAIAEGNAEMAAALTVAALRAHRCANMSLEEALALGGLRV